MIYTDFADALNSMELGFTVGLELDGIVRYYYRDGNDFYTIREDKHPGKPFKIIKFFTDAILSKKWFIVESAINNL